MQSAQKQVIEAFQRVQEFIGRRGLIYVGSDASKITLASGETDAGAPSTAAAQTSPIARSRPDWTIAGP